MILSVPAGWAPWGRAGGSHVPVRRAPRHAPYASGVPPLPAVLTRKRVSAPPGLLVILAALSVQVGASVAVGMFAQYGAITIVALRLIFGAFLVMAWRPPRLRGNAPGAWRWAIALGATLAFMNASFYFAIARLPLGVVVTIEFLGPLAAAVLGSRRPLDFAWVALAAAGVWILAGGRLETADALGVVAAGLTGVGWFTYIMVGGRVSRAWPDGSGVAASMSVSALLIVPVVLLAGDVGAVVAAPAVLVAGVVIALFSSALPYTLELAALGRLRPETYGILVSLEPAFGAIAGFLLLAQPLTPPELVAIALVTVASIGASVTARPVPEVPGELGG